jgi:hypothetical protein
MLGRAISAQYWRMSRPGYLLAFRGHSCLDSAKEGAVVVAVGLLILAGGRKV